MSAGVVAENEQLADDIIQHDDHHLGHDFHGDGGEREPSHENQQDQLLYDERGEASAEERKHLPQEFPRPVGRGGKHPDAVGKEREKHREDPRQHIGDQLVQPEELIEKCKGGNADHCCQPAEEKVQKNFLVLLIEWLKDTEHWQRHHAVEDVRPH